MGTIVVVGMVCGWNAIDWWTKDCVGRCVFLGRGCLDGHWFWNGLETQKRVVAVAKWNVGICSGMAVQ